MDRLVGVDDTRQPEISVWKDRNGRPGVHKTKRQRRQRGAHPQPSLRHTCSADTALSPHFTDEGLVPRGPRAASHDTAVPGGGETSSSALPSARRSRGSRARRERSGCLSHLSERK